MTRPRRKKMSTGKRGVLLAILLTILSVLLLLGLTEPRQLPAVIADQPAVRQLYTWQESAALWLHGKIYPLSTLRQDTPAPVKSGVGYADKDRDALDELIEEKQTP